MELVSSLCNNGVIPASYVHPPEARPGNLIVPLGKSIPAIDLAGDRDQIQIIQAILKASEEYGFFQVINHGVSETLMDDTMDVIQEFHAMSAMDKEMECSKDPDGSCKLYTSSLGYLAENFHYWRDAVAHPCHPLEECLKFWPQKPIRYREVIGAYSIELRKLSSRILEMICEGLGLETGYFSSALSENPKILVNHYPPCPDPSLTLGLSKHQDPSIITLVLQGHIQGLQVLKDDQWIGVQPLPHAFVVNIGYLLQIISNGKLKGAEHRVVTNTEDARTTISYFVYPSSECLIIPAKILANQQNPPLYKGCKFSDFLTVYLSKAADKEAVEEYLKF
ncbi:hypothetical protein SLEP1_g862 [Rubroshorea leprosula]|uniref:Fe2OG dioxygenase domain-containing protein n=1 Tax=Rubroshorea leprosula TaxID=152421 RepID=A0AAV5HHL3_9ROSI|nr:hypothetical protein SLEP1_g862 [Rubroshorea leprosula]